MRFSTLFSVAATLVASAVTLVNAQVADPYTDPSTNITFQRFYQAQKDFSFGIVTPETPSDEFIGQLTGPVKGGWTGLSLGGGMMQALLIVAWKNGEEIVHSFRYASQFSSPPLYTSPGPVLTPLSCGTGINETHWTLTFVCKGCNEWTSGGFDLDSDSGRFGWAVASQAPATPAKPDSPVNKHDGQGQFGVPLSAASSSLYEIVKARCK
ncbi:hypothetical protein DFH27DRAFT_13719 [Peziza echinospora]|nr:hypothetical protein DFH27DRAFT_13719 [Peziza echinospora]